MIKVLIESQVVCWYDCKVNKNILPILNNIAVLFLLQLPQGTTDTGNPWARVEKCIYELSNNSLQTRVMFNDLSVSGMVSLMPRDHQLPIPAESCKMTLRLRRAGIDFLTNPIARGRGQMRIRTESSFLEPRFASIYAYGCHTRRLDKQIKRQDKWPPFYPPHDEVITGRLIYRMVCAIGLAYIVETECTVGNWRELLWKECEWFPVVKIFTPPS